MQVTQSKRSDMMTFWSGGTVDVMQMTSSANDKKRAQILTRYAGGEGACCVLYACM